MKKLLLLTPFLLPAISNAQCVAGSGMCGPTATPQSISFIIFVITAIIFIVYLSHFSKKVAIKEMLKAFIDKEVIVVSLLVSSLYVYLFLFMQDQIIGYKTAAMTGVIPSDPNLGIVAWIMVGVGSTLFLMIPPLYFVFTRGWRHFLACFTDIMVLIFLISLLIIKI